MARKLIGHLRQKFPLVSMGAWAQGLACADLGARAPISASRILFWYWYFGQSHEVIHRTASSKNLIQPMHQDERTTLDKGCFPFLIIFKVFLKPFYFILKNLSIKNYFLKNMNNPSTKIETFLASQIKHSVMARF